VPPPATSAAISSKWRRPIEPGVITISARRLVIGLA
jgi:hypothetical protein